MIHRRAFLKLAGLSSVVSAFLGNLHPVLAATWQYPGGTITGVNGVRVPRRGGRYKMPTLGAGYYHSLALRSDGLVFGTGYNFQGQLGDNTTVRKSTYVQAVGVSNIVALAAGYCHSLALRSDGLVFASGYNVYGQLGNNTQVNKSSYVQAVSP